MIDKLISSKVFFLKKKENLTLCFYRSNVCIDRIRLNPNKLSLLIQFNTIKYQRKFQMELIIHMRDFICSVMINRSRNQTYDKKMTTLLLLFYSCCLIVV